MSDSSSAYDEDQEQDSTFSRVRQKPIGKQQTQSSTSYSSSSSAVAANSSYITGDPIPVPMERLEQYPLYPSGAIGTPVQYPPASARPTQFAQDRYYPQGLQPNFHSGYTQQSHGHGAPYRTAGEFNMLSNRPIHLLHQHGGAPMQAEESTESFQPDMVTAVDGMDNVSERQHRILEHLMNNSQHDILKFTEDNIRFSRRFYLCLDHSFFNGCLLMTVFAALFALATGFVSVVVGICEVDIDLYWYRTVYIILIFVIGLGIVAITTLHIYRNRNFSKDHVVAITLPALVFVVGAVMCGFGIQWYVNTHGTSIHWHSASQMSALTSLLLMNWAWGIILLPLAARAIACHYVPEQVEAQVAVEIGFTKDEIRASETVRNSTKIARRGMSSSSARK
jgi:hypothetical protein